MCKFTHEFNLLDTEDKKKVSEKTDKKKKGNKSSLSAVSEPPVKGLDNWVITLFLP